MHRVLTDDAVAVCVGRAVERAQRVVLVTFPGISRYNMDRWGDYWSFTDTSARRIFADVFGPENVTVVTYGNVLAACAFLQGIAAQELIKDELDQHGADYQVTIGIRVIRSAEH